MRRWLKLSHVHVSHVEHTVIAMISRIILQIQRHVRYYIRLSLNTAASVEHLLHSTGAWEPCWKSLVQQTGVA